MKIENTDIMGVPSIILGEDAENAYLFIHGKTVARRKRFNLRKLPVLKDFRLWE